jgi:hypothetical protein
MTLSRHGRACPGHPEMLCTAYRDARDKRGHDAGVYHRAMTLSRHGRACPGHPRLAFSWKGRKDVDARHKAGHDEAVCLFGETH